MGRSVRVRAVSFGHGTGRSAVAGRNVYRSRGPLLEETKPKLTRGNDVGDGDGDRESWSRRLHAARERVVGWSARATPKASVAEPQAEIRWIDASQPGKEYALAVARASDVQRRSARSTHESSDLSQSVRGGEVSERFESAKTASRAMAPRARTSSEGLCELPRVQSRCRPEVLPAMMRVLETPGGGHVMGVYSRLTDSTCWFLAVDFDKAT